ncbi:MAG: hypothetical protein ACRCV3_03205 [Desulfovibrionaceae bacterium]
MSSHGLTVTSTQAQSHSRTLFGKATVIMEGVQSMRHATTSFPGIFALDLFVPKSFDKSHIKALERNGVITERVVKHFPSKHGPFSQKKYNEFLKKKEEIISHEEILFYQTSATKYTHVAYAGIKKDLEENKDSAGSSSKGLSSKIQKGAGKIVQKVVQTSHEAKTKSQQALSAALSKMQIKSDEEKEEKMLTHSNLYFDYLEKEEREKSKSKQHEENIIGEHHNYTKECDALLKEQEECVTNAVREKKEKKAKELGKDGQRYLKQKTKIEDLEQQLSTKTTSSSSKTTEKKLEKAIRKIKGLKITEASFLLTDEETKECEEEAKHCMDYEKRFEEIETKHGARLEKIQKDYAEEREILEKMHTQKLSESGKKGEKISKLEKSIAAEEEKFPMMTEGPEKTAAEEALLTKKLDRHALLKELGFR